MELSSSSKSIPLGPGRIDFQYEPAGLDTRKSNMSHGPNLGLFLTWAHRNGFPDVGYGSYQPMQNTSLPLTSASGTIA
jgi:hypothetical protein